MTIYRHIIVIGRVQGVGFRVATQKQALSFNIRGYVRNMENGDVEILAHGELENIQQFLAWCHVGPTHAEVKEVIVNQHHAIELLESFQIF